MTTNTKRFCFSGRDQILLFPWAFPIEKFLYFYQNGKHDEYFTKYLVSRKQISDDLAADVKAKSIVNFNTRSFKVHLLQQLVVIKNSRHS